MGGVRTKRILAVCLIITVIQLLSFIIPKQALADFGANEAFSYDLAADLNGQSGGSGFGGNWSSTAGKFDIVSLLCESGNCPQSDANSDAVATRALGSASALGSLSFYILYTVTNENTGGFKLRSSAANRVLVHSDASGNIEVCGTTCEDIQATFSTNTLYKITVEYGAFGTCIADQVRAKVEGGSFSSCLTMSNSGDVDEIVLEASDVGGTILEQFLVDTIVDIPSAVAAAPAVEIILFNDF